MPTPFGRSEGLGRSSGIALTLMNCTPPVALSPFLQPTVGFPPGVGNGDGGVRGARRGMAGMPRTRAGHSMRKKKPQADTRLGFLQVASLKASGRAASGCRGMGDTAQPGPYAL